MDITSLLPDGTKILTDRINNVRVMDNKYGLKLITQSTPGLEHLVHLSSGTGSTQPAITMTRNAAVVLREMLDTLLKEW